MTKLNDTFVILYVKDGKAYPILLNEEQMSAASALIRNVVLTSIIEEGKNIQVLDSPIGEISTETVGQMRERRQN